MTRRGACFPSTPPWPRHSAPLPSHLVRRVRDRLCPWKHLHHLVVGAESNNYVDRSEMKRGISILRRAAALRHKHPLSAQCVRPLLHPHPPRHNTSTWSQPSKADRKERTRASCGHTFPVFRSQENLQINRQPTKNRKEVPKSPGRSETKTNLAQKTRGTSATQNSRDAFSGKWTD